MDFHSHAFKAPEGATLAGYTLEPTHIRIYQEDEQWLIDGATEDCSMYTESVWSYDTFAEAVAEIPSFVTETTIDGVKWQWGRTDPKRRLRYVDNNDGTYPKE